MADIIDAAGVSRTSFYAYFASKTAVIAECLREVMDQVMVAVRPFHTQAGGDAESRHPPQPASSGWRCARPTARCCGP